MKARLLHQLNAHHEVFIEEAAGETPVGANASNDCGQMDDDVRAGVFQQAGDVRFFREIVFPASRDNNTFAAGILQLADYVPPEESGAARYDYRLINEKAHR